MLALVREIVYYCNSAHRANVEQGQSRRNETWF